jgi:hypothetical protein
VGRTRLRQRGNRDRSAVLNCDMAISIPFRGRMYAPGVVKDSLRKPHLSRVRMRRGHVAWLSRACVSEIQAPRVSSLAAWPASGRAWSGAQPRRHADHRVPVAAWRVQFAA